MPVTPARIRACIKDLVDIAHHAHTHYPCGCETCDLFDELMIALEPPTEDVQFAARYVQRRDRNS